MIERSLLLLVIFLIVHTALWFFVPHEIVWYALGGSARDFVVLSVVASAVPPVVLTALLMRMLEARLGRLSFIAGAATGLLSWLCWSLILLTLLVSEGQFMGRASAVSLPLFFWSNVLSAASMFMACIGLVLLRAALRIWLTRSVARKRTT